MCHLDAINHKNMTQLTNRQQKILEFAASKSSIKNAELVAFFAEQNEPLSRETAARELSALVKVGVLEKFGKGRSLAYRMVVAHPFLKPMDYESYLAQESDKRTLAVISFKKEALEKLDELISQKELAVLEAKNVDYKRRVANLPPDILKKEFERITIEFSWKSSKIEGNTYTLLDTETLIKESREAVGHPKEEAVMILNHKKALDYIFGNKQKFKAISLRDTEDIHRLLVKGLNVNFGLREKPVGITGTNYRPLDNKYQIREALELGLEKINTAGDPWNKALIALIAISYTQPFEDGNKRTARLLANACLLAGGVCPLSLRSTGETEYKKAMLLFYELQNALLAKKLFLEQYDFSLANYFL